MKNNLLPAIQKAIVYLVLAFAFLLPIFHLPITVEFFEFNKLALSVVTSLVLLVLWGIKILVEGKVEVAKSPINIPIIGLVIVNLVSGYFSINKAASVLGPFGRWSPSILLITTCALLYFVLISNLKTKEAVRNAVFAFVLGTTASSLIALLAYFGLNPLMLSYASARTFTLTGSSLTTAALAAIGVLLSLGLYTEGSAKKASQAFLSVAMLMNFLVVSLVSYLAPWVLLVLGVLVFFATYPLENLKGMKTQLNVLFSIMIVLGVLLSIPSVRNSLGGDNYEREVKLGLRPSWIVTTSSLRDFPIAGSGPGTFYLDFSHYRPLSLNSTDQWNLRFDRPYNELLNVMATLGLVGLVVYVMFWYKAVRLLKYSELSGLGLGLKAAIMGLLAFLLLSHAGVLIYVSLFMLLALAVSYMQSGNLSESIIGVPVVERTVFSFATRTVAFMLAVPFFLFAAGGFYFGYRVYAAEVMLRRSITAARSSSASDLLSYQRRAIVLNPYVTAYHSSFAQSNFVVANALAGSKPAAELTQEERDTVQRLIAVSVQEARIATELLDRTNPATWEQRGRIYSLLGGVAKDAASWAAASYTRAIELDPTNPFLRLRLGGVYFGAKNYEMAERAFRASVALKPDYANAHYNLAEALREQKKYPESITQYEIALRLVQDGSEDFKKVEAQLAAIKALPEVAGAQTAQPTVSELTAEPTPEEVTPQEPLQREDQVPAPTIEEVAPEEPVQAQ